MKGKLCVDCGKELDGKDPFRCPECKRRHDTNRGGYMMEQAGVKLPSSSIDGPSEKKSVTFL